ncbi:MAG: MazG nucleotide pyrophosphohydrolase domain-containing protein [Candidatus Thermoplasmatota archaeon]|nr:MazG nucleotide pyrophosphohydrolase domain-containing protein [Candidatus Thermoplasmatota archaeon]
MEISEIQNRIRDMFGEEDKESGPMFLTSVLAEETGELARAVRGKGVDGEMQAKAVAEEAADVIFMALSIANFFGEDVSKALENKYFNRSKEQISSSWDDVSWK